MAAVTLVGDPYPSLRAQATVGTTLQEFTIPRRCRQISVEGDAALWVQFSGTDGGAVSATLKHPLAANQLKGWALEPGSFHRAGSIFVAAQSGTATVYVSCEATT